MRYRKKKILRSIFRAASIMTARIGLLQQENKDIWQGLYQIAKRVKTPIDDATKGKPISVGEIEFPFPDIVPYPVGILGWAVAKNPRGELVAIRPVGDGFTTIKFGPRAEFDSMVNRLDTKNEEILQDAGSN